MKNSEPQMFPLTPFTSSSSSTFPSLFISSSFAHLLRPSSPPPPLPPPRLFRPSYALCESVSCWAQTPAPHFLPRCLKSHRSGIRVHTALCVSYSMWVNALLHVNIHTLLSRTAAGVCVCVLVSRQYVCHCLLLGCPLTQLCTVAVLPRRVLCVFTQLHLHAFIIPDAGSHPA